MASDRSKPPEVAPVKAAAEVALQDFFDDVLLDEAINDAAVAKGVSAELVKGEVDRITNNDPQAWLTKSKLTREAGTAANQEMHKRFVDAFFALLQGGRECPTLAQVEVLHAAARKLDASYPSMNECLRAYGQ